MEVGNEVRRESFGTFVPGHQRTGEDYSPFSCRTSCCFSNLQLKSEEKKNPNIELNSRKKLSRAKKKKIELCEEMRQNPNKNSTARKKIPGTMRNQRVSPKKNLTKQRLSTKILTLIETSELLQIARSKRISKNTHYADDVP